MNTFLYIGVPDKEQGGISKIYSGEGEFYLWDMHVEDATGRPPDQQEYLIGQLYLPSRDSAPMIPSGYLECTARKGYHFDFSIKGPVRRRGYDISDMKFLPLGEFILSLAARRLLPWQGPSNIIQSSNPEQEGR